MQTQPKWGFYCEGTVLLKVTVIVLVMLVPRTSGAQLKPLTFSLSGEHYNNTSKFALLVKIKMLLVRFKTIKKEQEVWFWIGLHA